MPGVHAVLTHADVPGAKHLRARVRRPAGARDRPRPLLRRGRSRSSPPSTPSRRGAPARSGPRRLRAARAGDRHGARDRAARPPPRAAEPAATATATTRGRTSSARSLIRHGDPEPPSARSPSRASTRRACQDQAFLGPESGLAVPDGEGGIDIHVATQWLHVDRAQIAPCLGLPLERVRVHLAGVGGAFGGREDISMQIHAALLALHTDRPVQDRLQPRGVVQRPRPPPPLADLGAAHARRRDGRLVSVRDAHPARRRRLRLELDAPSARTRPPSPAAPTPCPNALLEATAVYTQQPALRRDARLRRRADLLRRRGADGQARRGARARPGRAAPAQRARARRHPCRPASGSRARCRPPR